MKRTLPRPDREVDGFAVVVTKINDASHRILDSGVYVSRNPTTEKDEVWMILCTKENTLWTLFRCVPDPKDPTKMVAVEEGRSELHSSKQKKDQLKVWKEHMDAPKAKLCTDDALSMIDDILAV